MRFRRSTAAAVLFVFRKESRSKKMPAR
ncbi:hypothetical protein B14911_18835 [Bacillus sp. NRRL B-14911]|nr:hypothetical protein B14911_18835 [Bacillus sp. NRRL B-14911]